MKEVAGRLIRQGNAFWLPSLILGSACKYAGYRLGKMYRMLPGALVRLCSMNPQYWDKAGGK